MIYFMMIRPQRKKDKADKEMRENIQVGDEVITIGGVVGRVEKITEKTVVISTGAAKNKIEFLKTAIANVSKTEASKPAPKKAEAEAVVEEKAPNRDKKVTPKKLSKKSDDAE
jgi:preprotein translocase subunit YajC